jgi:hypothetical protein
MPAVLNEAFNSPFNRHLGGTPSVSSGDTESIRNPLWNVQNNNSNMGPSHQYQINQPYESLFPRAQNTNYVTFPSQQTQYQPSVQQYQPSGELQQHKPQPVQYQPQPQLQNQHQLQLQPHDCERLIAMIMACAVCRNKIRDILRNDIQAQSGGAFPQLPQLSQLPPMPNIEALKGVNTTVIGNFIFGIAIIFLVDKIIKKRGCC